VVSSPTDTSGSESIAVRTRGTAILLLASAIWGFAFVAQVAGMEHLGPFSFNALRFLLGSLVLLPFGLVARRTPPSDAGTERSKARRGVLLVGLVLFASSTLQQVALITTTAGKAGFITGLYVILVPIYGLFLGQRVRTGVWFGAALAVGGLYLLTGPGAGGFRIGDALLLVSAFGWAIHVQLAAWLVQRVKPIHVAVAQTAICGLLSLAAALATETITLAAVLGALPALLFAGVMSVGIAYTLQLIGQRSVDPARAGILISLEAVFAVLGGWLILGETVTGAMLVGCALMLTGMIVSQLRRRASAESERSFGRMKKDAP